MEWYLPSVAGSDGISITNLGKFTAAAWTVNADIVSQSIRRSIPRERLFLTTEVTPSVVKSGTPPIVDRRKPRLFASRKCSVSFPDLFDKRGFKKKKERTKTERAIYA